MKFRLDRDSDAIYVQEESAAEGLLFVCGFMILWNRHNSEELAWRKAIELVDQLRSKPEEEQRVLVLQIRQLCGDKEYVARMTALSNNTPKEIS